MQILKFQIRKQKMYKKNYSNYTKSSKEKQNQNLSYHESVSKVSQKQNQKKAIEKRDENEYEKLCQEIKKIELQNKVVTAQNQNSEDEYLDKIKKNKDLMVELKNIIKELSFSLESKVNQLQNQQLKNKQLIQCINSTQKSIIQKQNDKKLLQQEVTKLQSTKKLMQQRATQVQQNRNLTIVKIKEQQERLIQLKKLVEQNKIILSSQKEMQEQHNSKLEQLRKIRMKIEQENSNKALEITTAIQKLQRQRQNNQIKVNSVEQNHIPKEYQKINQTVQNNKQNIIKLNHLQNKLIQLQQNILKQQQIHQNMILKISKLQHYNQIANSENIHLIESLKVQNQNYQSLLLEFKDAVTRNQNAVTTLCRTKNITHQ